MTTIATFIKKYFHYPKGIFLFSKEIVTSPTSVGAAVPSSKILAKAMAEQVPELKEGYLVELGAGTGVITKALLRKGIAPNKIIAVERSKSLCKHLHKRFPQLKIIHGDAANLQQLVKDFSPIEAIVSGLPLKSLPDKVVANIENAIIQCLAPAGSFIQFTYDLRKNAPKVLTQLTWHHSKTVWQNIPPAKVDVYSHNT